MVHDFNKGEILGELQDLDEEIEAVNFAIYIIQIDESILPQIIERKVIVFTRLRDKLKREKDRQQMRLIVHRQKVKESGIKY